MRFSTKWALMPVLTSLLLVACGGTTGGDNPANPKPGLDDSAFGGGKGDLAKQAKVVDNIGLDSDVEGEFDPRVRAYGYTFDVKKGAKLTIDLTATAGEDARGLEEGDTLDTVMALYKDFQGAGEVGEQIVEHDDGEDSLAAPSISFEVEETGTYFLAFMSYDDTGTGDYTVSVGCEGTDLQCRRPNYDKPCDEGELYVQGGEIEEDTTWNKCDVVLLEPTTVAEDAILTIEPGVTVKGNYISEDGGRFGDVRLLVRGTLQAVGTAKNPIAFTALKENGWGGIRLFAKSNTLEHIFVEKAETAIDLRNKATADVRHSLLEGGVTIDENEHRSQAGIRAATDAEATFTHALVKGFENGISARNTEALVVKHSVVRDNRRGVFITGEDHTRRCGGDSNFDTYRDPIFEHTDIFNNRTGIMIHGSNIFVRVEKSNIINNHGFGLELQGSALADKSYLSNNNIFGNNNANEEDQSAQVRTYHQDNTVVLENNYWRFISDPELHQSWDTRCDGDVSFTGFAPEPIEDAGPIEDEIKDDVAQQSWARYTQQNDG